MPGGWALGHGGICQTRNGELRRQNWRVSQVATSSLLWTEALLDGASHWHYPLREMVGALMTSALNWVLGQLVS